MPGEQAVELLVFELAPARYALPLRCVREVVRAVLVAPLPAAPPVVEGLINVRGDLVPVFDLRLRFGLPPAPLHPDQMMVVLWTGERLAAIRCDRADSIVQADPADVVPKEDVRHAGQLVSGVARLPDGPLLIHEPAAFLEQAERITLDSAMRAAQS